MELFTIAVGYTTTRPVVPDQFTAWVILLADNLTEAKTIAAQMVGCSFEMVTRTTLIDVEI